MLVCPATTVFPAPLVLRAAKVNLVCLVPPVTLAPTDATALIWKALGAAAITTLSAAPSYAATFVTITDNTSGQTATIVSGTTLISTTMLRVGNFLFTGLQVNANAPGTPTSATASDNKLNLVYDGVFGGATPTGSVQSRLAGLATRSLGRHR